jgi:hypothetical protein
MIANSLLERTLRRCIAVALIALAQLMPVQAQSEIYQSLTLQNGISAELYTPEAILDNLTERDEDGSLYLRLPGELLRYRLVEDIRDDVITNKGDGFFHPMSADWVVQAMADIDMDGITMELPVEVFILPYPRYYPLTSSTCGKRIFLSPGVYEVIPYIIAYTVTHEFGHAFQHSYLPDDDEDGWYQYLTLRGIYADPAYSSTAEHMYRPKEVFAEDFRYLFGGEYATYSGTIENPYLLVPTLVQGLEPFIASLVSDEYAYDVGNDAIPSGPLAVTNHPNPFNPSTVITVRFGGEDPFGAHRIAIKVFSVDGRLVKDLYSGTVQGDSFQAVWDGTDDRGGSVSSGLYFYRAVSGDASVNGKMLLLR